jgi:pimeloyl-ACP methyl ester carboxylesterase
LPSGASMLVAGDGERTVALIHGWEGRATQFAHFAQPLLAAGYRVVGVDGPAHGHGRGTTADPYRFAETLYEVEAQYGALHGVVGHSIGGGAIAIALASGLRVPRPVVIASPASLHDVLHRFAHAMHMPPGATQHFVEALRKQVSTRGHSTVDLPALLAQVSAPALVIHARDDREVPFADAERLVAAWRNATLLPVDGVGHRRILRSPAVIDAVVGHLGGGEVG